MFATEAEALQNFKETIDEQGFIDFDGQNCSDYNDDACAGWDGESRRCCCGNRRVFMSTVNTKDGWYWYAEAY